MSVAPLPGNAGPQRLQRPSGDRLLAAGLTRPRKPPKASQIARRRLIVVTTKWALPVFAVALLGSIAVWPELARLKEQGRIAFRRVFAADPDSGRMRQPRYRGVDQRGRPYTVTADWALQAGPQRIELSEPKGDMITESGSWVMVEAHEGVYIQHASQLDLSKDVVLYKDDGTIMRTQTAAMDVKSGTVASNDQTHAEGPFGVLDAQGFTMIDKGAVIQFQGPAHLIMNSARK